MNPRFEEFSDEDLMVQTREGDVVAFETLVSRHRTRLALYIANVLGNTETAEDLAQETFLRAFRARGRYVPTARWTTWVRKIAQNLSRDERRRRAFEPLYSLDEPCVNVHEASLIRDTIADSRQALPDAAICQRETLDELRRGVETLSPKHAQVLKMRVYDEMNYQEIADHLGCSLGTVKSRIHYAVQELRSRLFGDATAFTDEFDELPIAVGFGSASGWTQAS
jgi:RNA polymerase sigma-70 factor (ECF subfamily)